ncbi:MAG: peptidyl-prolyl cis-trans isomerase [Saprospiraceae bacterium]|nr:peptidyl-prolyl cis-trans isomerase [Saprospiraceae bacterium]
MRNVTFLFILFFFTSTVFAQKDNDILMTVGKSAVSVGEFKYIYEKNNGEKANYSDKSLSEYLDLYTNFKLKVEKAKQLKLDTLPELKMELQGYRKQLAGSYLIDKEVTENLLKELYERTKYDIEFSHIFLPVNPDENLSKKEEIRSQMMAIKSKIISGQSFEEVAKEFSKDPNSASKGGYMGFLNAKLPTGFYGLESTLYNTPIQSVSDIVESKIGFHLVKVLNKRTARGQVQVAHIFLKNDKKNTHLKADSLYNELMKGGDFSTIANQYSDDKNTSRTGGLLPPFGINTYENEFENVAFALANDGDISKPLTSKSGWHILTRVSKPEPDTYDIFVRKMKSQISKDERFEVAKLALINDIKQSNGFKENKSVYEQFVLTLQDDLYSYKWEPQNKNLDETLFIFGNSFISTLGDFTSFIKKNTKTRLKYDKGRPVAQTANDLYNEFVNEKAIEFEEKNLEYKYPDFKLLMREYEEGILLFEVTKTTVWDKANVDTIGLEKFYLDNKSKYLSEEKAKVSQFVIHSIEKSMIDKIKKDAKKLTSSKLTQKYNKGTNLITVTEETLDKSHPLLKGMDWKTGSLSDITKNEQAKHQSFRKIIEIMPAQSKTISEARGYVVADYQDFLEKQWVSELKKEFTVVINQPIFNLLKK